MEIESVMVAATCRTEGCAAQDRTFTVPMYPNQFGPEFMAQCDPCGQRVTDLVPVAS